MCAERVSFALSLVCLAGASAAAAAPAPEPTQPFTIQDMVRMERISDVAVAPDGKHVVYTERTTDKKPTKAAPAFGCSTPASAPPRRCA
jgi:hypothetical protein